MTLEGSFGIDEYKILKLNFASSLNGFNLSAFSYAIIELCNF